MAKKSIAPDWQKIALQLAQRVNFCVTHLHAKGESAGGGCLLDISSGTTQHWKDYCAEALEMVPGVKVDHELMHATAAQRRKIVADRKR